MKHFAILFLLFCAPAVLFSQTDTTEAMRLFRAADVLYKKQQFSAVVEKTKAALARPCDDSYACAHARSLAWRLGGQALNAQLLADSALVFFKNAEILRFGQLRDTASEEALSIKIGRGNCFVNLIKGEQALAEYRVALSLAERLFGPNSKRSSTVWSNMANAHKVAGQYEAALATNARALAIRQKLQPLDGTLLTQSFFTQATIFLDVEQPDSALVWLASAQQWAESVGDAARLTNIIGLKAKCLARLFRYEEAVEQGRIMIARRTAAVPNGSFLLAREYSDFAAILNLAGRFNEAKEYFLRAEEVYQRYHLEKDNDYLIFLDQFGSFELNRNPRSKRGEQMLLQTLAANKKEGAHLADQAYNYENLAGAMISTGELEQAKAYLLEALRTRTALGDTSSASVVNDFCRLSQIEPQSTTGNETALAWAEKAVAVATASGNQVVLVEAWRSKAMQEARMKQFEKSRASIEKARSLLEFSPEQAGEQPFRNMYPVLRVWEVKADIEVNAVESGQTEALAAAKAYLAVCQNIVHRFHPSLVAPEDRRAVRNAMSSFYFAEMNMHLLEEDFSGAFATSEKLLAQNLLSNLAFEQTGSPGEEVLKKAIQLAEARLRYLNELRLKKLPAAQAERSIPAEMLEQNTVLRALLEQFQREYPEKWENIAGQTTVAVRDLQAMLAPDEALIEFQHLQGEQHVFCMTRERVWGFTFRFEGKRLADFIEIFNENLHTNRRLSPEHLAKLQEVSLELYNLLFKEALHVAGPHIRQLTIVPNPQMANLPFAALLTAKPTSPFPAAWPYLAKKYAIRYAFSASYLWKQLHSETPSFSESFVGFAPDFVLSDTVSGNRSRQALLTTNAYDLPFAREEVLAIAALLNGKALLGADASETNFRKQMGAAQVLHLATHAMANSDDPDFSHILFTVPVLPGERNDPNTDGTLNAGEILGLRLPAELVTLSACQTADGQIALGEGLLGLTYAFTQAGARSVVGSFWSVHDQFTKELMINFYGNLKKGMPKHVALQQAQLALIRRSEDVAELGHPHFWAAFAVFGDVRGLGF